CLKWSGRRADRGAPSRTGTRPRAGTSNHGARRTRTADLLGAIQALFQLSYSPLARVGVRRSRRGKDSRMGPVIWASGGGGSRLTVALVARRLIRVAS